MNNACTRHLYSAQINLANYLSDMITETLINRILNYRMPKLTHGRVISAKIISRMHILCTHSGYCQYYFAYLPTLLPSFMFVCLLRINVEILYLRFSHIVQCTWETFTISCMSNLNY